MFSLTSMLRTMNTILRRTNAVTKYDSGLTRYSGMGQGVQVGDKRREGNKNTLQL